MLHLSDIILLSLGIWRVRNRPIVVTVIIRARYIIGKEEKRT
jgi:hypothetical protein